MAGTFTISKTETFTEADVKAVMQNSYEDIIGFANRKFLEYDTVKKWIEDLIYIMNQRVLRSFEIQLYNSLGVRFKTFKYTINPYGYLSSGSASGGIDYFDIPANTSVRLFADIDFDKGEVSAKVRNELVNNRGWGTNGSPMVGTSTAERTYASGTLELKRSVII